MVSELHRACRCARGRHARAAKPAPSSAFLHEGALRHMRSAIQTTARALTGQSTSCKLSCPVAGAQPSPTQTNGAHMPAACSRWLGRAGIPGPPAAAAGPAPHPRRTSSTPPAQTEVQQSRGAQEYVETSRVRHRVSMWATHGQAPHAARQRARHGRPGPTPPSLTPAQLPPLALSMALWVQVEGCTPRCCMCRISSLARAAWRP